jgi:hypothetical protein
VGIPVSLILIAVGLVLALAVNSTSGAVDVNTVGWIVFGVGLFGLILTLFLWDSWFGRGPWVRHTRVAEAPPGYGSPVTRRRTVVEEDDAPPPMPPP